MSDKLSTTNIQSPSTGVAKTLKPGNQVCVINSIEFKPFTLREGAYEILLHMMGPDLGPDFQGFFIDKNNESLGLHKGQVARVKATEWAFSDGETKTKIKISRDTEILKWLNSFCEAIGKKDWLTAQDNKHDSIESLVNAFILDAPYAGLEVNYCIAGKEYESKGYINYDLFLPKFTKAGAPFEIVGVSKNKLVVFNEATHLVKKKVTVVASFNPEEELNTGGIAANKDFEL